MNTSKLLVVVFGFSIPQLFAQAIPGTLNWYNGEGQGMYTDAAYKMLKKKKSQTVVVAVIDSGVDIEHEDLQGKIWVNTKEIPGNKIDDDHNGYVDDVHGWNFLGNANGENQENARLEKTRIYAKLKDKYDGVDPATLFDDSEYYMYSEARSSVESELENLDQYKEALANGQFDAETKKYIEDQLNYNLNINYDDRSLIGDNPNDFTDTHYGNGDVEGPDALHGTHVAGIIAAIRGNDKGGDGVAENVKIMSVRTVPNGDEQDKDVALAIRYAVDNGAQVINMSFGKDYSPHQYEVYQAMLYADTNGVLMIHAAGNDAKDVDVEPNFPTSHYEFQEEPFSNLLTIGASTRMVGAARVAEFSNFGRETVDVFAPGLEIYNTVPQSAYMNLQGTSMAAPMVTGAAAMLKSYYPSLSMWEIKNILLDSATVYTDNEFPSKSVTGGIVNLKNAVKMCEKAVGSK
ncbi:MAG: S8 family peptidase [Flavobacteriales bacterium]